MEPMFPALAGRFFTAETPRNVSKFLLNSPEIIFCEAYNGALTIYGVIQFISPMPFPENKTYDKKAFLTSECA